MDVKMSVGKLVVEGSHAAQLSLRAAVQANLDDVDKWFNEGYRKIVCKVDSLDELKNIETDCKQFNVSYAVVKDLGLTEIEPDTITAIGIGPAKNVMINQVTKHLEKLQFDVAEPGEVHKMLNAAVGFADAAEFWRKQFHREHNFVLSCCDASESVKFLRILEKGKMVTKQSIHSALIKARATYRDFTNEIADKDAKIKNLKKENDDLKRRIRNPEEFEVDLGAIEALNDLHDDLVKHHKKK